MSLSKLGLPGAHRHRHRRPGHHPHHQRHERGHQPCAGQLRRVPGPRRGAHGAILHMSETVIRLTTRKAQRARRGPAAGHPRPRVCIHRPEGAFFLWLWCEDLPITSQEPTTGLPPAASSCCRGTTSFRGWKAHGVSHECVSASATPGPTPRWNKG
ncbi:MAG: hypothetical protein R2854_31030 [Caldilineaceae bacterium]